MTPCPARKRRPPSRALLPLLLLVLLLGTAAGCEPAVAIPPVRRAMPPSAKAPRAMATRAPRKRPAPTGPQLVVARWPKGLFGDKEVHLRVAVRNPGPGWLTSARAFRLLLKGTLHVRTPAGGVRQVSLGLWRGPAPRAAAPGDLASHCMNGSVKGLLKGLGLKPRGTYRFWWTSQGLRSNALTVRFPAPACVCPPCRCRS
jgi:hypothetical protein